MSSTQTMVSPEHHVSPLPKTEPYLTWGQWLIPDTNGAGIHPAARQGVRIKTKSHATNLREAAIFLGVLRDAVLQGLPQLQACHHKKKSNIILLSHNTRPGTSFCQMLKKQVPSQQFGVCNLTFRGKLPAQTLHSNFLTREFALHMFGDARNTPISQLSISKGQGLPGMECVCNLA